MVKTELMLLGALSNFCYLKGVRPFETSIVSFFRNNQMFETKLNKVLIKTETMTEIATVTNNIQST